MSAASSNGATEPVFTDRKARADSTAALKVAKAAKTTADQSLALAKSFAVSLDEHSKASNASFLALKDEVMKTHQVSLQALEGVEKTRECFTLQFEELDRTVAQLRVRAAAEDTEEQAEQRAHEIIDNEVAKTKERRKDVISSIGWILAAAGSIASIGLWYSSRH